MYQLMICYCASQGVLWRPVHRQASLPPASSSLKKGLKGFTHSLRSCSSGYGLLVRGTRLQGPRTLSCNMPDRRRVLQHTSIA